MPQMSPLMWLYLFLAFSILTYLTVIKTFFVTKNMKNIDTKLLTKKNKKINWTW